MANPRAIPHWTPQHDDALRGLVGLGLGKQYAIKLLSEVKSSQLSDIMNEALRMHTASKKPTVITGGPRNAVPIKEPAKAAPAPAPAPAPVAAQAAPVRAPMPAPPPPPPGLVPKEGEWSNAQMGGQRPIKRPPVVGTPLIQAQWNAASMLPAQGRPPSAPIGPAAAQIQAPPVEKPRVRVRAAGRRLPAAPLGSEGAATPPPTEAPPTGAPPSAAPEQPKLPRIRSEEELAQLGPGTEFVWVPDGHIYRKNK